MREVYLMMARTLLLLSRFLVLLMMLLGEVAGSREPTNVYWNTSNPAFRSTANPAIEVNGDTGPWQFDQINIVCPSGPGVTEKHIIYSVTKGKAFIIIWIFFMYLLQYA